MGLKGKIRLLLDPEKRLGRYYRQERQRHKAKRPFALSADDLLRDVDHEKIEAIRLLRAIPNPGIRVEKYLEMDRWLDTNVRRILNIGLDLAEPKRVLDLGSGAGYFLYICKRLGHDVLGLDMHDPGTAWYGDLLELFGVQRTMWRIDPYVRLPELGKPFDYVCSFMVCFNRHISEDAWKVEEWRFFLDDLWTRLRPGAVVWFELNPGLDGRHYTPELRNFFEGRGAIVDGKRLVWGLSERQYRVLQQLGKEEAATLRKISAARETPDAELAGPVYNT